MSSGAASPPPPVADEGRVTELDGSVTSHVDPFLVDALDNPRHRLVGAEKSDALVDQSNGEEATAKLVEQGVAGINQDGLDSSVTNGHDHIDGSVDIYGAAVVLEVQGSKSKEEDTATFVEPNSATVDHDHADVSMSNGHDQVEMNDSGEVEAKSEVCASVSKGKMEECAIDATELVRQEGTFGEQGIEKESVVNGCDYPITNADSGEDPTQIVACSKEIDIIQSAVEGVENVHHERTIKVTDEQTEGDAKIADMEIPREEVILSNGYEHVEESADVTSVLEPLVGDGQHDFTPVDLLENRSEDNSEGILQDTITSSVDKAAVEAYALVVEKNDEAALEGSETKEKHEKANDEIVQVHDFSKDKECGVQGDELIKDDGDASTFQPSDSVLDSTAESEKEEVRELACLKETSLVSVEQHTTAALQETELKLSATPGNHMTDNTDNDKLDTELKQEPDMVGFDGAKLYAAPIVVSAFDGETRSLDLGHLADNDGARVEQSTPVCDLGTSSGAPTGDNDSKENSTAAVAQVEHDASKEHKTTVAQVEQEGPSLGNDNCPADGTPNEICSENANAFNTSVCEAETEYVEDITSTTVDVIHDEHNDYDHENIHNGSIDITGDRSESQSEVNMDNEGKGNLQLIKPHSIFLMKVPRFVSEALWAKIQDAQTRLDELTQKRDAINVLRQKKKALCDEYREQLEAARQEERGARAAHGDKRHDLNSVQSMIGRLNKANSIQEIDDMIAIKDKIIAHESISLKEEKLLLQEIKELKAQKKQLYSNMGSKTEMDEAFHQKEQIHEQHKTLKKDSDVLLTNLKSLEDKTRFIKKAFDDERYALRKLTEEHRAANEIRQKAYDEWSELKKEPGKKNKFFFMYKNDSRTAQEYVANGDMMGLVLFCNNQVESFIELWNKDDDFRRQYVESNNYSTLRRLGTSDGRALGPDEVPPEIPRNSNRMRGNPSLFPVSSTHLSTSASEAMPATPASAVTTLKEESFPVLEGPQNSKPSKPKVPGSSSSKEAPGTTMREHEDVENIVKEKMRRMEEELEIARQAAELAIREEELRQEKAAAEKEQLRLEQKAKAKEAEERKRRKAEKAQERADFRLRKEAELMEKKKTKKNKKKGSTSVDSLDGSGEDNAQVIATNNSDSSTTENSREVEFPQHKALKKRGSRQPVALKQLNKMEPMPLPLRNKGRRKMRQYIMVAVAAVVSVLALVVASKYVPSNFRASSS
ncbi:hypothetical protein ABZP36_018732 [Zizania latifolia]